MATPASLHTAAGQPANEQVERNPHSFIDDLHALLDQQLDPKEFYAELIKRLSEYLACKRRGMVDGKIQRTRARMSKWARS